MTHRRFARSCFSKLAGIALTLIALAFGVFPGQAQLTTTLIQFTNTWRYNNSGADLGTEWRQVTYDDSNWGSGPGLLGLDDTVPLGYFTSHSLWINTPMDLGPFTLRTPTIYFRTHFTNIFVNPATFGLSLIASNLVDDGCVIYLNGQQAGRVRVPTNQTFATYSPGPAVEGQLDVVSIDPALLRMGDNVLAVEVHQAASNSTDLVYGLRLTAIVNTPLSITVQPQSQVAIVGDPIILSVGVTGTPVVYQWQKDGVNLANGNSSTFSIGSSQIANSGDYRVIASNSLGSVTSHVATLTVMLDETGPRLVSANLAINTLTLPPYFANVSNSIHLRFNEFVTNSSATTGVKNTNNYRLVPFAFPEVSIGITQVLYNISVHAVVIVDASNPYWTPTNDYYLVVNNVADLSGNSIAPDSRIALGRSYSTNLLGVNASWKFHASSIFDPEVYFDDWQSTNYVESLFWAEGIGPFSSFCLSCASCLGAFQTVTGFQPEPMLFRTTFTWPTNWPSTGTLRLGALADNGFVLFLNGREILRNNVPGTDILRTTRAANNLTYCTNSISVNVTNLMPGTNWLAVAVVQSSLTSDGNSTFGLQMTGDAILTPELQEETQSPALTMTPLGTDAVRLLWTGGGYALESSTNLNAGAASHPWGPWQEVSAMSNPYTNSLNHPARFFRLKK